MTTSTRQADSDIENRLVRFETRLDALATKQDLANSHGELRTEMATRFGELKTEIEARFGDQDTKSEARFGELDTKIEVRFGELKTEIANFKSEIIRWFVGTVAVSTTVVVSIVTLIDQLSG